MLICNNCHHINEDSATQCGHCHMRGNFTYRKMGERKSDELLKKNEEALCLNCGSASPGDGERCVQCNFPRTGYSPEPKREMKVFSANHQEGKGEAVKTRD